MAKSNFRERKTRNGSDERSPAPQNGTNGTPAYYAVLAPRYFSGAPGFSNVSSNAVAVGAFWLQGPGLIRWLEGVPGSQAKQQQRFGPGW